MIHRALTARLAATFGLLAFSACGPGVIGGPDEEGSNPGQGSAAGAGSASAGAAGSSGSRQDGGAAGEGPGSGGSGAGSGGSGAGSGGSGADSGGAAGSGSGAGTAGSGGSGGTPSETDGVDLVLEKMHPGATTIAFGVPVPHGALSDVSKVRVLIGGQPVAAKISKTLGEMNGSGQDSGVRAFRVELAGSLMTAQTLDVRVEWGGPAGSAPQPATTPYASAAVSILAPATVSTATRTIQSVGGSYAIVEGAKTAKTLFTGREPRVFARFPAGYLASTGILGPQLGASATSAGALSGLKFVSDELKAFTDSSMYFESYALNPHPESVVDEITDYSAWLYDRCATYLNAYMHHGETRHLRHAFKACSFYSSQIGMSGEWAGMFTGKSYADVKYSHVRGLYAYYALSGDEQALAAGTAITKMWANNASFVKPYREGRTPGADKLWTERHLATSLEALVYGYQLTGDATYLIALEEMMDTAYTHVTGDAAALAKLNAGVNLPPQNCFIHSGLQQSEEGPTDPWCSPWMSAMLVDPLHEYQRLTGDARVDAIFVRLGRFLRDVGTAYFTKDLLTDSFLAPGACDDPNAGDDRRRLVPLYGAGIDAGGVRQSFGEWSDFEHCADATLLAAAAMASLKKTGGWDKNPIGSFASEGKSFEALHQELLSCAKRTFVEQTRLKRAPTSWTSAELAAGVGNPAFIDQNRIGFPLRVQMPRRKLSWWFNAAMLQLGVLDDAGIAVTNVTSGFIQPSGC